MSLSLISAPERWTSAYRPMEFAFRSTLFDMSDPGDRADIIDITQNALGETVLTTLQNFATGDAQVGNLIRITGTQFGVYDGEHRIRRIVSTFPELRVAISATYTIDDTGGTVYRLYDGLRTGVEVRFTANTNVVSFTVQPDADGIFTVNIADACARQFISPFNEAFIGAPNIYLSADRSIAMGYTVTAFERYIQWTDGTPTVVELRKPFQLDLFGYRVVNSCHPYHHEQFGGGIDMDWQSTYDDYVFTQTATGREFLTWGDRTTQKVKAGENFYLAMLWDANGQTAGTDFVVSTYTQAGAFIASQSFPLDDAPQFAALLNVGPAAIGSLLNDNVDYYLVGVRNRNDAFISETFKLFYDKTCGEVSRRFYWQNKLGGIDQFTFNGREKEFVSTAREEVSASYIPLNSTQGFNRRTYRTNVERARTISSDLLKQEVLGWLAEDLFESSDVRTFVNTRARTPHTWWTPVIILTNEAPHRNTDNQMRRMIFDYSLGVDNRSQFG